MSASSVSNPVPGCIVEFLQDNRVIQAYVLEVASPQNGNQLRLYTIGKRELKITLPRLLSWYGPVYPGQASRKDMDDRLEHHSKKRKEIATNLDVEGLWELAQGEVEKAPLKWFAELLWPEGDADEISALGSCLLSFKTHFKFSPPDFEIYGKEVVEQRLQKEEEEKKFSALVMAGTKFFRILWDIATSRRPSLAPSEELPEEIASDLKKLIFARLADPDSTEKNSMWSLLVKSLPEESHLPLLLAMAWGIKPPHYNFWLDRADYDSSDEWLSRIADDMESLKQKFSEARAIAVDKEKAWHGSIGTGFISIDPETTEDWDDAFKLEDAGLSPEGKKLLRLSIALANPAWFWTFGTKLDNAVMQRSSSIYLPEGSLHMMPRMLSLDLFSLQKGSPRPSLVTELMFEEDGTLKEVTPRLMWVVIEENLAHYTSEDELDCKTSGPFTTMLEKSLKLAEMLQKKRIERGAVITDRPEINIVLSETETEDNGVKSLQTVVELSPESPCPLSRTIVSEFMIACNTALATWGKERALPLLYRTQDVALPKAFSGVWTEPHEITRVVKALPPSILELVPKQHAGLGEPVYATFTSPMRRYPDLVNEAQIVHFLEHGEACQTHDSLKAILPIINHRISAVGQVQRFRPRYWKLLYLLQQNQMGRDSRPWWDATVTEENDAFVFVSLEIAQISLRAQRARFGDKIYLGQKIMVRLGKINPLHNDIQVLEVMEN